MPLGFPFDWKNPDYAQVTLARIEALKRIRRHPEKLPALKLYYRTHPAQFITDWGLTVDPRNVERGLPSVVPFVLYARQEEWIEWFLERWRAQEDCITEKSRDMGLSWLTIALSCTMCLFNPGLAVGFGSRKAEYVDHIGVPKSLFEKARLFMSHLPKEFRGAWDRDKHAPWMRIIFPDSGSFMGGESGDEIGRGDRTSFYVVDEAAFLERPERVDGALSQTTNCRLDVSTPNGMANSFARKRFSSTFNNSKRLFTFSWRDDPRKGPDWYAAQLRDLTSVIVAGEIDLNYAASVEGVLIQNAWVQAAIGAREKLNLGEPTGQRYAALDVADEGKDLNSFAGRHGVHLQHLKSWSGKGGDIYSTVVKTFALCDEWGYDSFDYDADGLGAGVRGDARAINETRAKAALSTIRDEPFRGSAAVWKPESEMVPKRKNKDYFQNLKAQSWWALSLRFRNVYRAVADGVACPESDLITIDPNLPELAELIMELSQPTWQINNVGKVVIDKMPDGMPSPNRADAVMICYQPSTRFLEMWQKLAG